MDRNRKPGQDGKKPGDKTAPADKTAPTGPGGDQSNVPADNPSSSGSTDKDKKEKGASDGTSPEATPPKEPGKQEKSVEQQYQDALKKAAAEGKPVVVVFGSQSALDTQKQSTQTLKQNMAAGDASFLYVDTDKLDPNSDLGRVARRSEEQGLGLGPDGKSDMVFTGVYNVVQQPNGELGLGNSVATFWGGRPEISSIMNQQMQFAKRSTLRLENNVPPPAPRDGTGPVGPNPDQPRPNPDQPDQPRPDQPQDKDKTPEDRKKEQEQEELRRREEEKKKQEQEKEERRKTIAGDKNYSLEEYQDGWGKLLERSEVDQGPVRDLVNEFGRQMISGQFNGKQLAGLMDKVGATNQQAIQDSLHYLNEQLAGNGLKLSFGLDEAGKISGIEMSDVVQAGAAQTSVQVNSAGEVVSQETAGDGSQPRRLGIAPGSLRIAKKAEPAACP